MNENKTSYSGGIFCSCGVTVKYSIKSGDILVTKCPECKQSYSIEAEEKEASHGTAYHLNVYMNSQINFNTKIEDTIGHINPMTGGRFSVRKDGSYEVNGKTYPLQNGDYLDFDSDGKLIGFNGSDPSSMDNYL